MSFFFFFFNTSQAIHIPHFCALFCSQQVNSVYLSGAETAAELHMPRYTASEAAGKCAYVSDMQMK